MLHLDGGSTDGVINLSCMAAFDDFDIIHSFSIDYMHQTLLVVRFEKQGQSVLHSATATTKNHKQYPQDKAL